MKHESLDGKNPEAAKESVLSVIDLTRDQFRGKVLDAMAETGVDDGARGSIWVNTRTMPGGLMALADFDVSMQADSDWSLRVLELKKILRSHGFEVEFSKKYVHTHDLWKYSIVVRHRYGSV